MREGIAFELPWGDIWINSICFSKDDRFLISASDDHTIVLWSFDERKPIQTIRTDDTVVALAFSPVADQLVYGDGAEIMPYPIHPFSQKDPRQMLETAQRDTGLELEGFKLVPMDNARP